MGPVVFVRRQGWESRLADVIARGRTERYELGVSDCFSMACAAVQALTGVDLWAEWAGRYRTRREALRLLHEYAGAGFTEAFSKLFGSTPTDVRLARRGDIVEYIDAEPHLGVCLGSAVAVREASELVYAPLLMCRHAWRIG